MNARKYVFPNVVELNLAAGRSFGVNVYLIDGGTEYVLLDIGQEDSLDEIIDLIRSMDYPLNRCKMVIATHADADHVQGLAKARERLKTKSAAHPKAAVALESGDTLATYASIPAQGIDLPMPPCKIDVKLNEGDVVKVGKVELQVWHTPGHTPGQLSFKMNDLLFSGDNVYADGCVGTIDAHHGTHLPDLIASLKRIQGDDAKYLLPSHGPMFKRDPAMIQKVIDRVTGYLAMADFGTCATDWPLQREWEQLVLSGAMPDLA